VGPAFALVSLNVGGDAAPIYLDWNNDDMTDIVVGDRDGAIHLYRNCGCGGWMPPHFSYSPAGGVLVQAAFQDLLVPGGYSSPVVVDLDGDGKKDLLVGNGDGQILFYRNTWTDAAPMFSGYSQVRSAGQPICLLGSSCTRPFACHWTGTGYWDLLVGYGDGKIHLYRAVPKQGDFNLNGALDSDDLTALIEALDKPVPPGGSPYDLNHDGVVDNLDLRLFADLWLADHAADTK
jgi:hypothetical protein